MENLLGYQYPSLFDRSLKMTTAPVTLASGKKGGALVEWLVIAKYLDRCSPLHFYAWLANQYLLGKTSWTTFNSGTIPVQLISLLLVDWNCWSAPPKGLISCDTSLDVARSYWTIFVKIIYSLCLPMAHIMQPLAICNYVFLLLNIPLLSKLSFVLIPNTVSSKLHFHLRGCSTAQYSLKKQTDN